MAIETTRTSIPAKAGNLSDLTVMSYDSLSTWDRGSLMCVITCQSHVTLATICESCEIIVSRGEIHFFVYKKSEKYYTQDMQRFRIFGVAVGVGYYLCRFR